MTMYPMAPSDPFLDAFANTMNVPRVVVGRGIYFDQAMKLRYQRYFQRQRHMPHEGQQRLLQAVERALRGEGPKEIWVEAGKQSGKSECLRDIVADTLDRIPDPGIWECGPTYDVSDALYDRTTADVRTGSGFEFQRFEIAKEERGQPKALFLKGGGFIKSKSWNNTSALEVDTCDLVVCDESQNGIEKTRYALLRARVLARGGVLIFIVGYVPGVQVDRYVSDTIEEIRHQEQIKDLFEDTAKPSRVVVRWHTEDNPNLGIQEGLREERALLTKDEYNTLYGAHQSAITGAVFPTFKQEIHERADVAFNRAMPVEIAIDPGVLVYAINAIQYKDPYVLVLETVYVHDGTCDQAIAECRKRDWWNNVRGGVIDIAAKRRTTNGSIETEAWRQATGLYLRMNDVSQDVGVRRLRSFLIDETTKQPRLFLRKGYCRDLIEEFHRFRFKPSGAGNYVNRDDHALNALWYWLVDKFGALPDPILGTMNSRGIKRRDLMGGDKMPSRRKWR